LTANHKIAVVGTGLIGASWAVCFLAGGYAVVATDPGDGAEERLWQWVNAYWPTLEQIGLADGATRDNLSFTRDIADAVQGAIFIQESGPERLDIKRSILAEIEAAAPTDSIIASSTSGLLISEIQAEAKHPERILLGHPFNPPHLIPLVEVLGGTQTSAENVSKAMAFYTALGKTPIRINREIKGHVANRLQVALWREAFSLVQQGVVSVEDIDAAIANGPGLRWALLGPFLNLHASGGPGGISHMLRHLGPAMRDWANDLGDYPATDDFFAPVEKGVAAALEGCDFTETLRERDALLLKLIAAKKDARHIP
jgi:3-hydroxyacyl-CoA dehydrogenase